MIPLPSAAGVWPSALGSRPGRAAREPHTSVPTASSPQLCLRIFQHPPPPHRPPPSLSFSTRAASAAAAAMATGSRESRRSPPRTSRAIVEVGSIPGLGVGVRRRTAPVAVAASGARWREGRRERRSGPADQLRGGRLGERGGSGPGARRNLRGRRWRWQRQQRQPRRPEQEQVRSWRGRKAGPGREEAGWLRVGAEEPGSPPPPLPWSGPARPWRGARGTLPAGLEGGGVPSPAPAPAAEGRRAGVGAGGARGFVLRLARRGDPRAAEVELSRAGGGGRGGGGKLTRGR